MLWPLLFLHTASLSCPLSVEKGLEGYTGVFVFHHRAKLPRCDHACECCPKFIGSFDNLVGRSLATRVLSSACDFIGADMIDSCPATPCCDQSVQPQKQSGCLLSCLVGFTGFVTCHKVIAMEKPNTMCCHPFSFLCLQKWQMMRHEKVISCYYPKCSAGTRLVLFYWGEESRTMWTDSPTTKPLPLRCIGWWCRVLIGKRSILSAHFKVRTFICLSARNHLYVLMLKIFFLVNVLYLWKSWQLV